MNHILVPVDFSPNTKRQLDYLVRYISDPAHTLITLVHSVEPPPSSGMYDQVIPPETDTEPAREKLEAAAEQLRQALPGSAVQISVRIGLPSEELRVVVRDENYDAIVIGTHNHGPLHDFVFGSVAAVVFESAKCPVHVVPPREPSDTPGLDVLAAIDLWSESAAEVIKYAVTFGRQISSNRILVVHSEQPDSSNVYREWSVLRDSKEERRAHLHEVLEGIVKRAFPEGAPANIVPVIEFGAPLPFLRKQLAFQRPAVLVIGAHRHGPMHDLLLGSVSRKIVKKADIPVILVPSLVETQAEDGVSGGTPMLTSEQRVDFMKYFPGLDREHRDRLLSHARRISMDKGNHLTRVGRPAQSFYLILSGRVSLMSPIGSQSHIQLQEAGPGELIGFSWICPDPTWSLDTVAMEDLEVLEFDAGKLLDNCEEDAHFAVQVMRTFCGLIFDRLKAMRELVTERLGSEWVVIASPGEPLSDED